MKKTLVNIYNYFYNFLREISNYSMAYGAKKENNLLLNFLKKNNIPKDTKILDVGCGYGRIMELIQNEGYKITGVDANIDIVNANKIKGFDCISVDEFKNTNEKYDLILMCHIIEHMNPPDLLQFMDYYLNFLKEKGKLIIITPIFTKAFYTDFDHIKPYSYLGINMVFSGKNQVQYYSKNKLKFINIKFIHVPYTHRTLSTKLHGASVFKQYFIDLFFLISYYISFSIIGINANWVGFYLKEETTV